MLPNQLPGSWVSIPLISAANSQLADSPILGMRLPKDCIAFKAKVHDDVIFYCGVK